MVVQMEVTKRFANQEGATFHIPSVYNIPKRVAAEEGYDFFEVTHRAKPEKYGHLYEFEFVLKHKFDYFARNEIRVEFVFEDVKRVKRDGKSLEQGDGRVRIVTNLILDYENHWGTSALNRFLFKIYQNYIAKERIKKLYIIPSIIFTDKLYEAIKEGFALYQ